MVTVATLTVWVTHSFWPRVPVATGVWGGIALGYLAHLVVSSFLRTSDLRSFMRNMALDDISA